VAATPLEHMPRLQQLLAPAEAVARVTHAYLSVRYAEHETSPAELSDVRAQLDHVHGRETADGLGPDV
jgi:hypothetical protein